MGFFQIYTVFLTLPSYTKPSSIKFHPNSLPLTTTTTNLLSSMACVCPHILTHQTHHPFLFGTSLCLPPNVITASVALALHTCGKFNFHLCHMLLCYFFNCLVIPSFHTLSLIDFRTSENKAVLLRLLNTDIGVSKCRSTGCVFR